MAQYQEHSYWELESSDASQDRLLMAGHVDTSELSLYYQQQQDRQDLDNWRFKEESNITNREAIGMEIVGNGQKRVVDEFLFPVHNFEDFHYTPLRNEHSLEIDSKRSRTVSFSPSVPYSQLAYSFQNSSLQNSYQNNYSLLDPATPSSFDSFLHQNYRPQPTIPAMNHQPKRINRNVSSHGWIHDRQESMERQLGHLHVSSSMPSYYPNFNSTLSMNSLAGPLDVDRMVQDMELGADEFARLGGRIPSAFGSSPINFKVTAPNSVPITSKESQLQLPSKTLMDKDALVSQIFVKQRALRLNTSNLAKHRETRDVNMDSYDDNTSPAVFNGETNLDTSLPDIIVGSLNRASFDEAIMSRFENVFQSNSGISPSSNDSTVNSEVVKPSSSFVGRIKSALPTAINTSNVRPNSGTSFSSSLPSPKSLAAVSKSRKPRRVLAATVPPVEEQDSTPRDQKLKFPEDMYTPKLARYSGSHKEGFCDICQPGKWLQLKNSAFWYHNTF
jgi:hypothetical protein